MQDQALDASLSSARLCTILAWLEYRHCATRQSLFKYNELLLSGYKRLRSTHEARGPAILLAAGVFVAAGRED
jgi:hypothetical protein